MIISDYWLHSKSFFGYKRNKNYTPNLITPVNKVKEKISEIIYDKIEMIEKNWMKINCKKSYELNKSFS